MSKTTIEWTDESWNPIRAEDQDGHKGHYCEKISPGCANCYASRMQRRFHMPTFPGRQKGERYALHEGETSVCVTGGLSVYLDDTRLVEPLSWRRPRKVFVCDMSDLFGAWVPFEWIDRVFAVMALTPHVTYQVLTKRPERMAEWLDDRGLKPEKEYPDADYRSRPGHPQERIRDEALTMCDKRHGVPSLFDWPLPNVWLGTSVEDQRNADARIPHLLRCPAAVRFLSVEPLLSPIIFASPAGTIEYANGEVSPVVCNPLTTVPGIDWVIVGGESGPGARPLNIEWVRSIVGQCKAAGVACFVKQLGRSPYDGACDGEPFDGSCGHAKGVTDSLHYLRLNDAKGGDPAEWSEDLRVREFPNPQHAAV